MTARTMTRTSAVAFAVSLLAIVASPSVADAQHLPCSPRQIAPGKWVRPLCRTPMLSSRTRIVRPQWFGGRAVPESVDHRVSGLAGPVKDQGQVGLCWAFALASSMETAARNGGVQDEVSPLHIVAHDLYAGLYSASASLPAIAAERVWRYDEVKGCKVTHASDDCGNSLGVLAGSWRREPKLVAEFNTANAHARYQIRTVDQLDGNNPNDLATAIAQGDAVWVSIHINWSEWHSSAVRDGKIDAHVRADGALHAVALSGYRTRGLSREFLVKNSWGTSWGKAGYAWIPESALRRHAVTAFRVRLGSRRAPTQRPSPPVASSCAVRDLFTSQCATSCQNGLPPIAGVCPAWPPPQATTTCANGFPALLGVCL